MDILLKNGEIFCIDGDARNLIISCQCGSLWITQTGDVNDYIASSGADFKITRKGKIAVTALDDARISFTSPMELKQVSLPWQVLTA